MIDPMVINFNLRRNKFYKKLNNVLDFHQNVFFKMKRAPRGTSHAPDVLYSKSAKTIRQISHRQNLQNGGRSDVRGVLNI